VFAQRGVSFMSLKRLKGLGELGKSFREKSGRVSIELSIPVSN
jgi:hypothetical protein